MQSERSAGRADAGGRTEPGRGAPERAGSPHRILAACWFGLVLAAPAADAWAYKCTPVTGARLTQAWNQRCIPYHISRAGVLFSGESRKLLIDQSFRVWSDNACTDLAFSFAGYTDDAPGFDVREPESNKNLIMSIETPEDRALFPDPRLLAITLTSFSVETGEIFDADVLFNGTSDYSFVEVQDVGACNNLNPRPYDLRNTLVHELGHFVGFDHESMTDSTMFAMAEACETKKRDLTADDRLGMCTVYPAGQETKTCQAPDSYDKGSGDPQGFRDQCVRVFEGGLDCGCSAARSGGLEPALLLGLTLLWVLRRRRRRG